jgi:hypothetical protein
VGALPPRHSMWSVGGSWTEIARAQEAEVLTGLPVRNRDSLPDRKLQKVW